MELGLPRGEDDSLMHAILKRRKIDDDGNPIVTESTNSLVDMRAYEILMAPLKYSQIKSLQIIYLHRLMNKDTGNYYLTISSAIEEIMMQSTRVMHSLRLALEIGNRRRLQKVGENVSYGKMFQPIG